jgi:hypothetical protein
MHHQLMVGASQVLRYRASTAAAERRASGIEVPDPEQIILDDREKMAVPNPNLNEYVDE